HCRHYLCIAGDEGLDWFSETLTDFTEALDDLSNVVGDIILFDGAEQALASAPVGVRALISPLIREENTSGFLDLGAVDDEVVTVAWTEQYTALFHPDAPRFALRLRATAERALAWVETATESDNDGAEPEEAPSATPRPVATAPERLPQNLADILP